MNNNNQYNLSKIEKTNPFTTPNGYFDSVLPRLQEKINTPATTSIRIPKPYLAYAAAAIVTGIIVFISLFYQFHSNTHETAGFAEIIDYETHEIDESAIIEIFEDKNTDINVLASEPLSQAINDDYKNEVIEYLIDDNIEYLTILDEF
jgi:hypothetical protein